MKNKASLIPFAIIALVTVLGCGRLTEQVNQSISNDKPPSALGEKPSGTFTLDGKEWQSYELTQTDIKVELPGLPGDKSPAPSQFPRGTQEIFSSMRIHSYDEGDFGSSYSQLAPTGKRSFTIKELADTSMAALKKQAPDLTYTLDVKSPTNAKYNGTFTRNGKSFELRGCCIFKKENPSRVWAVITLYAKDNADGKTASERIIDSVVFAGSSETCN